MTALTLINDHPDAIEHVEWLNDMPLHAMQAEIARMRAALQTPSK